nr:MAG TPA: hypothetical protein [Caudoviricetes sp.]
MTVLPIMKVKHKKYGIEMIINQSDFDETVHENLSKKPVESKKKKADKIDDELKVLMGEE